MHVYNKEKMSGHEPKLHVDGASDTRSQMCSATGCCSIALGAENKFHEPSYI
jgi:hypothetical protein